MRQSAAKSLVLVTGILFTSIAWSLPTLWGIDEDDGELFRIDDYTLPSVSYTSYGQLKWDDNGIIKNVGNDIESFTVSPDGIAYMVVNDNLGALADDTSPSNLDGPILLGLDLNTVSTSADNLVNVIGVIDVQLDSSLDSITGLDFDPVSGSLYALMWDNDSDDNSLMDRLLRIDKDNADVLGNVTIDGIENGEDLLFLDNGAMLVVDENDNSVYYIDPDTGLITGVFNSDIKQGLTGSSYFEGLAWDAANGNLLAYSDVGDFFAIIADGAPGSSSLGQVAELTDVEGIDFWNTSTPVNYSPSGNSQIILPGIAYLILLGLFSMALTYRYKNHGTPA